MIMLDESTNKWIKIKEESQPGAIRFMYIRASSITEVTCYRHGLNRAYITIIVGSGESSDSRYIQYETLEDAQSAAIRLMNIIEPGD